MLVRRFFPLVALVAFSLTGCDVLDELQQTEPVPLPLTSIRIAGIPDTPSGAGNEWDDDGTGPDLFVEIQNPASGNVARSETLSDVDLTQPLALTFSGSLSAPSSSARLSVVLFEADGSNLLEAERVGSSESFSVDELLSADGVLLLESNSSASRDATFELVR